MHMMRRTPLFRLSVLQLALVAGFAYAQEAPVASESTELSTIQVDGNVRSRAPSDWKSATERSTMNFKDLVADQVGITFGGGSVSAQWLSVRGVGQNRVDMIVDNTATSSQLWHHQSRFMFDPAMVKIVGVDKGAGSASSGIGVTSGSIRAETVDASDLLTDGKPFGFRVGTNWNSNKGIGGNLAAYTHVGGFDGLIMGSWQRDKDYEDGSGKTMTNTARDQDNYLLKLGYAFNPDHRIGFSYRREHYSGDNTMRPEYQCFASPSCDEQRGPMEQVQQTYNLEYKAQNLGFARDMQANVYHIKAEDERPQFSANRFLRNGVRVRSDLETTGANIGFTTEMGSRGHLLKYGLNYRHEEVSAASRPQHFEEKKDYGIYAEAIWNLAPVTLTTGLRYDYFEADSSSSGGGLSSASGGKVNPSIGVIWDINSAFAVRAKWNQASRSPQLTEAFQTGNGTRGFTPGLKPETAQLAEIGFDWNHASGFALSGSVFHQRIRNWMQNGQNAPVRNVGTLKTNGYELNAAYRRGGLTARIGTSRANIQADGFNIPTAGRELAVQGQQWLTSLSYRFGKPNLEIGWRGRYMQGKEFTSGTTRHRRVGFGVHDIYANWQPLGKDTLNVNFAVYNVADKQYRSHSQTASNNNAFYEPGREFRLGVNYRF